MAKKIRRARPALVRVSVRVPPEHQGLILDVGHKLAGAGGAVIASGIGRILRGELELLPPPGARLHTLRVYYHKGRDWPEAIDAAGPNTPANYNVRQVGDQYPPEAGKWEEDEIILLNFPNGGSWDQAIAWAEQFGLERTDPREVFAIGERHPNLHRELGLNPMWVVATKDCSFDGNRQACYVWWDDSKRKAHLICVEDFGNRHDWFAFRRKRAA